MAKKRSGLAGKIRAHMRALEAGKKEYKRADALLEEILEKMKVGEEVKVGDRGQRAKLKDNFEDKNTVYRAHGIRRYELELVEG